MRVRHLYLEDQRGGGMQVLASAPVEDAMAASRSSIHRELEYVLGQLFQASCSLKEGKHHSE